MKTLLTFLLFVSLPLAAFADALDEANMQRRNFGLPPLTRDAGLMRFAQQKAQWKAAHLVNTKNGYNGHEGLIKPDDCREGTGALSPDWGFAVCWLTIRGSYPAGAGVAIGSDGRRYMVLVVRTRSSSEIPLGSRPLVDTSGLTPDAPKIKRCNHWPPREPVNRSFSHHPLYVELTRLYWENSR